jgi:hypothetical protein
MRLARGSSLAILVVVAAVLAGLAAQPAATAVVLTSPEVGQGGAVQNADGRVEVFALNTADGSVWHAWETSPGGAWHAFASLFGSSFQMAPVASINSNGTLAVFDIATDGHLYVDTQVSPGGAWTGWESLGAPGGGLYGGPGELAVGQNADGRLEVFAFGVSQVGVWHIWQTAPSGPWGGWAKLGGGSGCCLAVTRNADGRLEAFDSTQPSLVVQHVYQEGPGGSWSGWSSLGLSNAQVGAAAENPNGTLEVVATQSPSAYASLFASQAAPGGSWTGWTGMTGPSLSLSPTVINVANQYGSFLDAFAAGDGLLAWTYTNSGDHFLGWATASEPPGGIGGYSLAAVANTSGAVEVFATGSSDVIWLSQLSPSHVWSGWSDLG